MGLSKKTINKISSDVRKHCIKQAKQAKVALAEEYENAINYFYDDFSPKYYDRTYEFRDRSLKKIYHKNRGIGRDVEGGIVVSSEKMRDYKSDTAEIVFENAYGLNGGSLHGWDKGKTNFHVKGYMRLALKEIAEKLSGQDVIITKNNNGGVLNERKYGRNYKSQI